MQNKNTQYCIKNTLISSMITFPLCGYVKLMNRLRVTTNYSYTPICNCKIVVRQVLHMCNRHTLELTISSLGKNFSGVTARPNSQKLTPQLETIKVNKHSNNYRNKKHKHLNKMKLLIYLDFIVSEHPQ